MRIQRMWNQKFLLKLKTNQRLRSPYLQDLQSASRCCSPLKLKQTRLCSFNFHILSLIFIISSGVVYLSGFINLHFNRATYNVIEWCNTSWMLYMLVNKNWVNDILEIFFCNCCTLPWSFCRLSFLLLASIQIHLSLF